MNSESSQDKFTMDEPKEIGVGTRYAFWLTTMDQELFDFVRELICVASVTDSSAGRALIAIKDSYDADEEWHWIRMLLEEEVQFVKLDKIWEDALAWL